jgi:aldehyde:ferredoxin oxidoreductase
MEAFGYAGRILRVDLSSRRIDDIPTSDYADRFLGGRGIATRLYWDHVPPEAQALAPENAIVRATGTPGPWPECR